MMLLGLLYANFEFAIIAVIAASPMLARREQAWRII